MLNQPFRYSDLVHVVSDRIEALLDCGLFRDFRLGTSNVKYRRLGIVNTFALGRDSNRVASVGPRLVLHSVAGVRLDLKADLPGVLARRRLDVVVDTQQANVGLDTLFSLELYCHELLTR